MAETSSGVLVADVALVAVLVSFQMPYSICLCFDRRLFCSRNFKRTKEFEIKNCINLDSI